MTRVIFTFSFLLLSGPARANIDEARINMDTAVRTFVSQRTVDGWWPLRNKKTGKVMKLQLARVDPESVHVTKEGLFAGIATLNAEDGSKVYAEFTADLSGDWQVTGMRLLKPQQLGEIRRQAKIAEARRAAKNRVGPAGSLPDVTLSTLSGGSASPADCPAKKCVTVYVAPWCPHCRNSSKDVLEMREYLKPQGIAVRVIVGMDTAARVKDYAQTFGPDTMLDPDEAAKPDDGVPAFAVSEDGGAVFLRRAGAPEGQGGKALAEYLAL